LHQNKLNDPNRDEKNARKRKKSGKREDTPQETWLGAALERQLIGGPQQREDNDLRPIGLDRRARLL